MLALTLLTGATRSCDAHTAVQYVLVIRSQIRSHGKVPVSPPGPLSFQGLTVMRFYVCLERMSNALFEMTPTEVLERLASGDSDSVIANIADPIERWEIGQLDLGQVEVDEDALHDGCYPSELLDDIRAEERSTVCDVIGDVGGLGEKLDSILERYNTVRTRNQAWEEALEEYVQRRIALSHGSVVPIAS